MQFSHIINAALSNETDRPLMQKEVYPVSLQLQSYLQLHKRDITLPVAYTDLFHYRYTNAIRDKNGRHTHWENVVYDEALLYTLQEKLIEIYCLLMKLETDDLIITAIDFCEYANSMPFRITLNDLSNGETHFFYIKAADSSRIYGLELEQLLSPNPTHFLYHQNTLIEQHIDGLPGDEFAIEINHLSTEEKRQLAEEFIRFNERSFARLLGDMRSYNFVTKQTGNTHNPYRIRAIDFDQQSYEGRLNLYLPQFYKENIEYVQLVIASFTNEQIEQIRQQERVELKLFAQDNSVKLNHLLQAMATEEISDNYKVLQLRNELNSYFKTDCFSDCSTMGALVRQQLTQLLGADIIISTSF
jgi:hypothetical protein